MLFSTFALGTVEKFDNFLFRDFYVKSWTIARKDDGAKFSSTVPDSITREMATNCCLGGSDWMVGNAFSPGGQCSTGATYAERLSSLSFWKFSRQLDKVQLSWSVARDSLVLARAIESNL